MGYVFPKIVSLCVTRSIKEVVGVLQRKKMSACALFARGHDQSRAQGYGDQRRC
ncbi:unnamed protein product [Arabidopsis lyrata]|nr:unnamed protein product [Arabidopsis lyrata]